MRLLAGLGVLSPIAIAVLVLGTQSGYLSTLSEGPRGLALSAMAAVAAVTTTALIVWLYMRLWFGRLVRAAEKIAEGNLDVRVSERGGGLDGRLAAAINGIAVSMAEKQDAATIDKLTGVANRQQLLATLFNEVERASRYNRPFSVAFVDIDHFKTVNDTYGHAAGDIVLRGVAQTIHNNLRGTDLIGRYGGEEFLLTVTADRDTAEAIAERLRTAVGETPVASRSGPIAVSVSVGVGHVRAGDDLGTVIGRADQALYCAKQRGRDNVVAIP